MTLTVHTLLHIADTIETIGLVWVWQSFLIECQCGRFQQKITAVPENLVPLVFFSFLTINRRVLSQRQNV